MCMSPGVQSCSGCHSIRYCSKRCQKADWLLHKLLCKTFKDFSYATRPENDDDGVYKRAILFSEKEDCPRWFWPHLIGPDTQGRANPDFTHESLREDMRPILATAQNKVLQRHLPQSIGFAGLPDAFSTQPGSKVGENNRSFLNIDHELSEWVHAPIMAVGVNGVDGLPNGPWQEQFQDLTPTEFRHAIDTLRYTYDKSGKQEELYMKGTTDKVKAVRANCCGDEWVGQRGRWQRVEADEDLCDMESELEIDIANKVGMPLVARKLPHALSWRGRKQVNMVFSENFAAIGLQVRKQWEILKGITDPAELDMVKNKATAEFEGKLGSVVVVRQDGKKLEPIVLAALQAYAKKKVSVATAVGMNTGVWKEDVLNDVSMDEWRAFYDTFVSQQIPMPEPLGFIPNSMPGIIPNTFHPHIPGFTGFPSLD